MAVSEWVRPVGEGVVHRGAIPFPVLSGRDSAGLLPSGNLPQASATPGARAAQRMEDGWAAAVGSRIRPIDEELMNQGSRHAVGLVLLLVVVLAGCRRSAVDPAAPGPSGTWTVVVGNPSGEEVTFQLDVEREGEQYRGALRNGDDLTPATGGSWDGKTLRLLFDYYDGELVATVEGDEFRGQFKRQWQKQVLTKQIRGRRGAARPLPSGPPGLPPADGAAGDRLTGDWVLAVGAAPNQKYWRAALRRDGEGVVGTISTVSGDWGQFSGTFDGQQVVLNRFDGINSRLLRGRLGPDGRLEGVVDLGLFDPVRPVVGERLTEENQALVRNLPDSNNYTRMANPAEPFRFAFPDLRGQTIASTDDSFRDKVVVVSITGSWCPNCHEESPLLQQYYEKYQARGLAVVALAFEYTGDPARDGEQLRIFANRHRLTYPLLLAGTTDEGDIGRRLPQLVNFAAYPTTIFIGRDGLVRRIHTGFEGKATGERHIRLKAEYQELIEQLLAE
jgi:thiol-disulfide isomerase/thioredoxin